MTVASADLKSTRLTLMMAYRAALRESDRTPAQAVLDLIFNAMADIGVFNRQHPQFAITPADCTVKL